MELRATAHPVLVRPKVECYAAMLLNEHNLQEAAIWCGGHVVDDSYVYVQTDVIHGYRQFSRMGPPKSPGYIRATIGDLIWRDTSFVNSSDQRPFTVIRAEDVEGFLEPFVPVDVSANVGDRV